MISSVKSNSSHINKRYDILGISSSLICIIHCVLSPVIFAARPLYSSFAEHQHQHGLEQWLFMDIIFIALALFAVQYASKHSSKPLISWGLWISWTVFSLGLIAELVDFTGFIWLSYLGSIGLIGFHFANLYVPQRVTLNT